MKEDEDERRREDTDAVSGMIVKLLSARFTVLKKVVDGRTYP